MASSSSRPGRAMNQMRTMTCERGVLNRADGSAQWSQENTIVLAAVYGPRQASMKREDAEQAVVEVLVKPRNGLQDSKCRELEVVIRGVLSGVLPLTLHPRTSVVVVLQVIQDDGALLSCALNAACSALMDAGMAMSTSFGSFTCALMPGSVLALDPNAKEERLAEAVVSVANPYHFDFSRVEEGERPATIVSSSLLLSQTSGKLTIDQLFDAMQVAAQGTAEIAELQKNVMQKG